VKELQSERRRDQVRRDLEELLREIERTTDSRGTAIGCESVHEGRVVGRQETPAHGKTLGEDLLRFFLPTLVVSEKPQLDQALRNLPVLRTECPDVQLAIPSVRHSLPTLNAKNFWLPLPSMPDLA